MFKETIENSYSNEAVIHYVSSDKIKQGIIDDYLAKHPYETHSQAHEKMNKYATQVFEKELSKLVSKASDYHKVNFVFVDKNFPISQAEKLMTEYKSKHFLIFYPKVDKDCSEAKLPFSYDYMIQCYHRLKNRKNHETLDFDKNEFAHYILFSFICLYRNSKFEFGKKNVQAVPLSITDESKAIEYDAYFKSIFKQMINSIAKIIFDVDKMREHDKLISEVVSFIESNYPQSLYADTRDILRNEINQILYNLSNI